MGYLYVCICVNMHIQLKPLKLQNEDGYMLKFDTLSMIRENSDCKTEGKFW